MNSVHLNEANAEANAEAEAKAKAEAKAEAEKAARCKQKDDAQLAQERADAAEKAKTEAAEEARLNAIALECSDILRSAIEYGDMYDTDNPYEAEEFLSHNVDDDKLQCIVNYYGNLETIFDLAKMLLEKINEKINE